MGIRTLAVSSGRAFERAPRRPAANGSSEIDRMEEIYRGVSQRGNDNVFEV